MSIDNTAAIAISNGCEVVPFDTNNTISDRKYLQIKDNAWKTDWVLVCDMDELLDINEEQLKKEESLGYSIIKSEGYNMVNMEDNFDLPGVKHGFRFDPYDKYYLFNKKFIKEINYQAGCHWANPIGDVKLSETGYRAYHYTFINADVSVKKYAQYAKRLSAENLKIGWGTQYLNSEKLIRDQFADVRKQETKIL